MSEFSNFEGHAFIYMQVYQLFEIESCLSCLAYYFLSSGA